MRWFKRGVWITAWGVWAWLGVGLHRELPRRFGAPVCTIGFEKFAILAGFVGDSNRFAVVQQEDRRGKTKVPRFDASSGGVVGETTGPTRNAFLTSRLDPIRRELLFASELQYLGGSLYRKGLFSLDLTTMEWRRVSDHSMIGFGSHHPSR